jgi:hypothetical protein
MKNIINAVLNFFSSYLLASVVLTLLTILTLFGTLEQVNLGLFDVQKRYFESIVLVHWVFDVIPVPMLGGYLLMSLLGINLLCGAIIRARKDWRRPGMLIAHSGILFLLVSGLVTYHASNSGHMTLFEGDVSGEFQSYYDWEIVVTELGGESGKQYIIGNEALQTLSQDTPGVFFAEGLPFEIMVEGFERNVIPRLARPGVAEGVDGIVLEPAAPEKEAERNVAGCYVVLVETGGASAHEAMANGAGGLATHQGVLYGMSRVPWVARVGERDYAIDLRHRRFPVPFTIRLDKFIRDLHPRTGMAANFESVVTKTQDGLERQIEIKMNQPLRQDGYTFFQASWGPENARPGEPLFSTFSVVDNPADQWPLYSCIIIAVGLLWHFVQKLLGYLRMENRKRARS